MSVVEIIQNIRDTVPETETRLLARLKALHDTSLYTAPERMLDVWHNLNKVLLQEIDLGRNEPWITKVQELFLSYNGESG